MVFELFNRPLLHWLSWRRTIYRCTSYTGRGIEGRKWDKIDFEEVRNGNNFPFNRKDSTYREAVIPKLNQLFSIENGGFANRVEDFYNLTSACEIFSKDVLFENSFTIKSERTSYTISTSPSARGDVCPSVIRWKWARAKISPGTLCESCPTPPGVALPVTAC